MKEKTPVNIQVMFRDGHIYTFENAIEYGTFKKKGRYYIQLQGGKRVIIDKKDVLFIELPYLNYDNETE